MAGNSSPHPPPGRLTLSDFETAGGRLFTFVTTWMEPQATRLMAECVDKNMIDKDEYPQTAELEGRCVRILANLWHAPDAASAIGCSTTGSSEACMLAGLALKRRWSRGRGARRPGRPNLVMGANVQAGRCRRSP